MFYKIEPALLIVTWAAIVALIVSGSAYFERRKQSKSGLAPSAAPPAPLDMGEMLDLCFATNDERDQWPQAKQDRTAEVPHG